MSTALFLPTESRCKTRINDAAWAGRALASGRATFGPPLQHRPYQERNSKSCQLIEGDSLLQTYANDAARRVV